MSAHSVPGCGAAGADCLSETLPRPTAPSEVGCGLRESAPRRGPEHRPPAITIRTGLCETLFGAMHLSLAPTSHWRPGRSGARPGPLTGASPTSRRVAAAVCVRSSTESGTAGTASATVRDVLRNYAPRSRRSAREALLGHAPRAGHCLGEKLRGAMHLRQCPTTRLRPTYGESLTYVRVAPRRRWTGLTRRSRTRQAPVLVGRCSYPRRCPRWLRDSGPDRRSCRPSPSPSLVSPASGRSDRGHLHSRHLRSCGSARTTVERRLAEGGGMGWSQGPPSLPSSSFVRPCPYERRATAG